MQSQGDSDAYVHLRAQYPELTEILDMAGEVTMPSPRFSLVEEAVISTIAGQMLSRQAAATIYSRVELFARRKNLASLTELLDHDLRAAGLSQRKVKTIRSFQAYVANKPHDFHRWKDMTYDELKTSIKGEVWGFSDWSISMIAIFHFNHQDVFPSNDGTIKRAIDKLTRKSIIAESFDASKAKPYSTYLALLLWRVIDKDIVT